MTYEQDRPTSTPDPDITDPVTGLDAPTRPDPTELDATEPDPTELDAARPGTRPAKQAVGRSSSVWFVGQQTLAVQRRGRFVRESGQHPGRMAPALAAEAIRRYTRPGDLVVDPMCGIGTTLVEAAHAGRAVLGIEYEPRWADIARANLALASRQGGTGPGAAGMDSVITGDARHLPDLLATVGLSPGSARLVLTSPPYGDTPHGRVKVPAKGHNRQRGPVVSHLFEDYGQNRRDRANLAHTDLTGMREGLVQILTGVSWLLHPDGVAVLTARPWRRDGLLIDLPGLIIEAAEQAGLHLRDRCVAILATDTGQRLIPRHSFHQLLQLRRSRSLGARQLLIAHEDVLLLGGRSSRLGAPGG